MKKTSPPALKPTLDWEIKSGGYPRALVCGVDEVGRGCLAGPVVAGAVILPARVDMDAEPWLSEVTDSKNLSPEVRSRLAPLIEKWALASAIGAASVEEIDQINIYHASHLAMVRALEGVTSSLGRAPDHVLVDGNVVPKAIRVRATAVVRGDLKCLSIAAGSIIAKVYRDRLMEELDVKHPGYGFAKHKGYSTPMHFEALAELGACEIHRRSFAPVAKVLELSLV